MTMNSEHDELPELSPPDTSCKLHEERPAFCRCPVCHQHVCGFCWFTTFNRCHACVFEKPEEVAKIVPWEDLQLSIVQRYARTLSHALSPERNAPSFAFGEMKRAWVFFLLTFIPLTLLRGVIPYTHKIQFRPSFSFIIAPGTSTTDLVLDISQAMLVSFVELIPTCFALWLCYQNLTQAFAPKKQSSVATRLILYRAFLIPLATFTPLVKPEHMIIPDGLILSFGLWMSPAENIIALFSAIGFAAVIPFIFLMSLRSTARITLGAETLPSYVIAILSMVFMILVNGFVHMAIDPWIPQVLTST